MILEGLLTTVNEDGSVNVAPMGPIVDEEIKHLTLRPYETSRTYHNLIRTRQGVFHLTDDVELLARAAVDRLTEMPPLERAARVEGWILSGACRWFAFEVRKIDTSTPRGEFTAEVVDRGQLREFLGFNRGKHAVIEAAILASRTAFLPAEDIRAQMQQLKTMVDKTGGVAEQRAFAFLDDYIRAALGAAAPGAVSRAPTG